MKKYVLPYGQGSKEIELDETLVLKEVRTKEFEAPEKHPLRSSRGDLPPDWMSSHQRNH